MHIAPFVASLILVIWMYLLTARGGFWRTPIAPESSKPSKRPEICVVIPARNEADILADTLPSLLEHDYPLHIILVDDRSDDATAATATRIAEQYNASNRLTVVSGRPLPSGWKGKVAAMQYGLEQIQDAPRYVLFTDADIAYQKGALKKLVAHAEAEGFVLASLMVKLRCVSFAEKFLIPAFVYFFRMLYPFAYVNDPRNPMAAAAGGCMLVRYDALMSAGGLAPIRGALIDDCALGRLMKKHGPISLNLTQDVLSRRPYPAISDIRVMVARSAYDQLGYSIFNLAGAVLGMLLTYAMPVLLAIFASGTTQLLGMISWLLMSVSFLPVLRFYKQSPLLAVTLPAVAVFYMGFTLDSAYQYMRGRGGLWKGRVQARAQGA